MNHHAADGLSDQFFDDRPFVDCDWADALIEAAEFRGCTFTNVIFRGSTLKGCRFNECRFVNCDLSLAEPVDTLFAGCTFRDNRMVGINWTLMEEPTHSLHDALVFYGCDISLCDFSSLDLTSVTFTDCRARDAIFRETTLVETAFDGTDLNGADFAHADLSRARLAKASGVAVDPLVTKLDGTVMSAVTAMEVVGALGIVVATE